MPPEKTTRRGFLGIAGGAAAIVAGVATVPVICAGPAHAAADELPIVLNPNDPGAVIPEVSEADYADGVSREPLNQTAVCALTTEEGENG